MIVAWWMWLIPTTLSNWGHVALGLAVGLAAATIVEYWRFKP